jgi:hypothetical protein
MNAAKNNENETIQTSPFDPFPEPRTVPNGWDVSNLISKRIPKVVTKAILELERKYRYPGIMYD